MCGINLPFFHLALLITSVACYCNPLESFVADTESSEVFQDTWMSSLSKLSKGFLQDCIYNFFAKPEHKYYAIVLNTLSFLKALVVPFSVQFGTIMLMFVCLQWATEKLRIFKRCVSAEGPKSFLEPLFSPCKGFHLHSWMWTRKKKKSLQFVLLVWYCKGPVFLLSIILLDNLFENLSVKEAV